MNEVRVFNVLPPQPQIYLLSSDLLNTGQSDIKRYLIPCRYLLRPSTSPLAQRWSPSSDLQEAGAPQNSAEQGAPSRAAERLLAAGLELTPRS